MEAVTYIKDTYLYGIPKNRYISLLMPIALLFYANAAHICSS